MDKELLEALSQMLDEKLDNKLDGLAKHTADLVAKLEELKEVEEVTNKLQDYIFKLKM